MELTLSSPAPRSLSTPPHSLLPLQDRRHTLSDLERASETLAHAVNYLVGEQLAGRRPALVANREAIAILADAGRHLLEAERRRPAQQTVAAWLCGALRSRALHQRPDDASN